MSHSSPVPTSRPVAAADPAAATVPSSQIDAGFLWPLSCLFGGAILWLLVSSLLGLIASVKMHAPGMMADCAWLTYGRIRPAASQVFLYGFALQASLGIALWLMARLCRTNLVGRGAVVIAGKVWNLGILVGLFAILAGGNTGYERFEFPAYVQGILLMSLVTLSLCALLTFQARRVEELYPSVWYLVAAFLCLPWLLSTAWLLLLVWPVHGAAQMAVQNYYANGIYQLGVVPLGVAILLYLMPLLAGKPLHSRYLAMFAFWMQVIFGSWTGLHNGAPMPAWMVGVGVVSGVMLALPLFATLQNLCRTRRSGNFSLNSSPGARFLVAAIAALGISGILGVLHSWPSINRITQFSLFTAGLEQLAWQGFLGSAIFAALYHIVPSVTGSPWPCLRMVRVHFWLHVVGFGLAGLSLVAGGVLHGLAWANPNVQAVDVARRSIPFIGMASLGNLLVLAGSVCLSIQAGRLAYARLRACCVPWMQAAVSPANPVVLKA